MNELEELEYLLEQDRLAWYEPSNRNMEYFDKAFQCVVKGLVAVAKEVRSLKGQPSKDEIKMFGVDGEDENSLNLHLEPLAEEIGSNKKKIGRKSLKMMSKQKGTKNIKEESKESAEENEEGEN